MRRRPLPFLLCFPLFLALPGIASAARADGDEERRGAGSTTGKVTVINDWLLRRAALLAADSSERAELYARITSPVVRARLLETEALAREQLGDLAGAILRYDSLGRVVDATRLRLQLATSAGERAGLRHVLTTWAADRAGTGSARAGIDLLLESGSLLSPKEALSAARTASRSGMPAAAVRFYPRAIAAGLATPEDRLGYGMALARLGRHREAIAAFGRIVTAPAVAAEATYQRAWSESRLGARTRALASLSRLIARHPTDAEVTPRALFFAGDLAWRSGNGNAARHYWLQLADRFPGSDSAGRGGFLAALVEWEAGRVTQAAAEWERIHQLDGGPSGLAAGYWAGRAYERLGQDGTARVLWQSVIARDSTSYYAVASARRLGVSPWRPLPAPDEFTSYADLDSALTRITLLREASLDTEAEWEKEWLLADSVSDPERLLATADGFRRIGLPATALTFTWRALRAGAPRDARTYRLLYPLSHGEELTRQADLAGLDPLMVAALIRQESAWDPLATSRAGALGLMQVMPATGRQLARSLGIGDWTSDLLLDPATNLRLGVRYLAQALHRFHGDFTRALAAYNAGPNRVGSWSTDGDDDPELFVERISIPETRDYVRIVQRNVALYRALYGEGQP